MYFLFLIGLHSLTLYTLQVLARNCQNPIAVARVGENCEIKPAMSMSKNKNASLFRSTMRVVSDLFAA